MKEKHMIIFSLCLIVFVILLKIFGTGILIDFEECITEYIGYIAGNPEHKADLVESVIGGICSGAITFIALFITIKHENNKGKRERKEERKREREKLFLSVRPVLDISVKTISELRGNSSLDDGNIIVIGDGLYYKYVVVTIANRGYGRCLRITMNDNKFSVRQLDVDEEQETQINIKGFGIKHECQKCDIKIGYNDIFGNRYLQNFCFRWNDDENIVEIDSYESLLENENDE